jgi:S-(hydroxymethyl)glutathione dehydrogenase/alcohol dehydrogenase
MEEKSVIGTYYGSPRLQYDVPRIIDLYMAGRLKLDELITETFPLADINRAFEAMQQGNVARSVIAYG